jgi:hypothetical protein
VQPYEKERGVCVCVKRDGKEGTVERTQRERERESMEPILRSVTGAVRRAILLPTTFRATGAIRENIVTERCNQKVVQGYFTFKGR